MSKGEVLAVSFWLSLCKLINALNDLGHHPFPSCHASLTKARREESNVQLLRSIVEIRYDTFEHLSSEGTWHGEPSIQPHSTHPAVVVEH